ncbi:hypothetical protein PR048_014644 [Dryococelus australis]|uniref:Integrase catalytic domain-containing protein n=1 Tax=Dryococelus australis TaxID=614101 RepID=A0ABQ9HEZ2_9NEOP|nr:hypothetical protein PR048_014644 [Dryococelus australis]
MEDYVIQVLSLAQRMANINAPIDDEFVGILLLSSLSEYDPMFMALGSSGTTIASDFVKNKLLQDIKKEMNEKQGVDSTLTSNVGNRGSPGPNALDWFFKSTKEREMYSDVIAIMRLAIENLNALRGFRTEEGKFINLIRLKDQVCEKLKEFKTMVENKANMKLKYLQSDNGTECVNKELAKFLVDNGIKNQITVEFTAEQNGVAERTNCTIVEKARTMMQEAGLGPR